MEVIPELFMLNGMLCFLSNECPNVLANLPLTSLLQPLPDITNYVLFDIRKKKRNAVQKVSFEGTVPKPIPIDLFWKLNVYWSNHERHIWMHQLYLSFKVFLRNLQYCYDFEL